MDCPVYATLPVNQMGQLVLYDFYMVRIPCCLYEPISALHTGLAPLWSCRQADFNHTRAAGLPCRPLLPIPSQPLHASPLIQSKVNDEDFDLFDLKDVDEVFTTRIQHLKYSQRLSLRGGSLVIGPEC